MFLWEYINFHRVYYVIALIYFGCLKIVAPDFFNINTMLIYCNDNCYSFFTVWCENIHPNIFEGYMLH